MTAGHLDLSCLELRVLRTSRESAPRYCLHKYTRIQLPDRAGLYKASIIRTLRGVGGSPPPTPLRVPMTPTHPEAQAITIDEIRRHLESKPVQQFFRTNGG